MFRIAIGWIGGKIPARRRGMNTATGGNNKPAFMSFQKGLKTGP